MQKLYDFIKSSPTALHATENVRRILIENGYRELYEADEWHLEDGKGYFTVRHGSALAAFVYRKDAPGFMITASHTDSPAFKIKDVAEKAGKYTSIPTEKYGGMIMYSWLDRPLSVAGRLVVRTEGGIRSVLVDSGAGVLTIPSIAIHMNRSVNDGYAFNPAKDTVPLFAIGERKGELMSLLAEKAGVRREDIVSHDLYVTVSEEPREVGYGGELILSPRLDDLECVHASLEAFLSHDAAESMPVFVIFDSEEVGSATVTGADSTFLSDVLCRASGSQMRLAAMLTSSIAVSADNAHALHPNAEALSDSGAPTLGGGIVIKYNSQRRYATDAVSSAIFTEICERAGAKTQTYYNRADVPGGSTLGALLDTQLSVMTVDIGLPQLAMHSSVETAAKADYLELAKALKSFYSTSFLVRGNDIKIK